MQITKGMNMKNILLSLIVMLAAGLAHADYTRCSGANDRGEGLVLIFSQKMRNTRHSATVTINGLRQQLNYNLDISGGTEFTSIYSSHQHGGLNLDMKDWGAASGWSHVHGKFRMTCRDVR